MENLLRNAKYGNLKRFSVTCNDNLSLNVLIRCCDSARRTKGRIIDGGISEAAACTAVSVLMSGLMVSPSNNYAHGYKDYLINPTNGICLWIGTAPWCRGVCPPEFEAIRHHGVRAYYFANDVPDPYFEQLLDWIESLLLQRGQKDPSWGGHWTSRTDAITLVVHMWIVLDELVQVANELQAENLNETGKKKAVCGSIVRYPDFYVKKIMDYYQYNKSGPIF
uniref:Uncharacterized protein n=1 Tax=Ditylenchus dipsaci TaxID=166011 RepID=A0A915DGV5_9BILA